MRTAVVGRQSSVVRTSDDRRHRRPARWATKSAILLCFGACVTSAVLAQDSTTNATSDSAWAACAAAPRPVASMVDTIYGSLEATGGHSLPDWYPRLLLRGLIEHFSPPSPLGVPAYGAPIHQHRPDPSSVFSLQAVPESVTIAISGEVLFTLERSGHLSNARLVATSLSSALDERLLRAVTELDSTHTLPPFPADVSGKSMNVFFAVDGNRDSTRLSEPLFIASMPVWVLGQRTMPLRGGPFPDYPRREEIAGVEGDVLMSFIVDERGAPRMDTARLLAESGKDFGRSVMNVLPRLRFEPARISGCPVAQLVQMPFRFRVP